MMKHYHSFLRTTLICFLSLLLHLYLLNPSLQVLW